MSLEQFGGGVPIDQPNKEDRDNVELSRWLAGPDVDVYWDRSKSYSFGTFTTGMRRTPDLVIQAQVGDYQQTYAVEVKPPDDNNAVQEGLQQAQQYWKDIECGRAEYELGSDSAEIDAVLTATRNSPAGHLFDNEHNNDPKKTGRSRDANDFIQHGHCPQLEHAATAVAVRQAYYSVRDWCEINDHEDVSTGFGYLTSMCLDGGEAGLHSTPAAFYLRPKSAGKTHNWVSIPFTKKDG
jgi:hypothetical protein